MKFLISFIACAGFYIHPLRASTPTQDVMSPLSTDAAYAFWTGATMTTYLLLTEDTISDVATRKTYEKKPLGDASKFGDLYGQVYPNIIYFAGMGLHGFFTTNKKSFGRASHMFKATLYSTLLATVLKYSVREPRPNATHEKNSFPSGHTTTAFAFATVIATQHEWYWGFLAMGGAALTGYSRMNDGRHFLHDVVAGMTIGVSYGLGTYFTQYQGQGKRFAISPIIDHEKTGIRLIAAW
jgi:membrane-associated phospholipid phosphatase